MKTKGFTLRKGGGRFFRGGFEDGAVVRVIEEDAIAGVDAFTNGSGEAVVAVCAGSVGGKADGDAVDDQAAEAKDVDVAAHVGLGKELVLETGGLKNASVSAGELDEIVVPHEGRGEGHGVGGAEVQSHVCGNRSLGRYGNLRLEIRNAVIEIDGNDDAAARVMPGRGFLCRVMILAS